MVFVFSGDECVMADIRVSGRPGLLRETWKKCHRPAFSGWPVKLSGWLTGLEPAASRTTICEVVVPSGNLSGLMATEDSRCSTGCTSKTKKARRSPSKAVADTAPAAAVESSEGGFAKALLMIALLPLSDAEKADAVRRLMSDQATGPVCGR